MQYLLMLFADEQAGAGMPKETMAAAMGEMYAYVQALQKAKAFVATHALDLTSNAATVRNDNGSLVVRDGPYAETREQFGGYFIIEADDMDEALKWAARCPAASWGTVEVRRIREPSEFPSG
jgi:hypothetical protein